MLSSIIFLLALFMLELKADKVEQSRVIEKQWNIVEWNILHQFVVCHALMFESLLCDKKFESVAM